MDDLFDQDNEIKHPGENSAETPSEEENEFRAETEEATEEETEDTAEETVEDAAEESAPTYSISYGENESGEVRYTGVEPIKPYTYAKEEKRDRKSKNGAKIALAIVAVLLVVGLSGVAGFVGSLFAGNNNYYTPYSPSDNNDNKKQEENNGGTFINNGSSDEGETTVNIVKKDSNGSAAGSVTGTVGSYAEVVRKVQDTVVEIYTTVVTESYFYGKVTGSGAGSGVIVSADGFIVTNNHVIEDATDVTVRLTSGEQYAAELWGTDASSDIAIIKIKPESDLPFATLGCSADLAVGEEVLAIGNPLGTLGGSVTNGIISALARKIETDTGVYMTLLQTNAAINPGNSGGGLFNMAGELIGVVNAKYSDEEIEGLGFAIPIDTAFDVMKELIEHKYVTGIVDYGLSLQEYSSAFRYRYAGGRIVTYEAGVYVVASEHTSISVMDRIVSVNGITVKTMSDFEEAIADCKVGDTLSFVLYRNGGEVNAEIVLTEYVPDYIKSAK